MLLFGAGDFSVAIGKPGQVHDPEVAEVRARVAKAARAAGKAAGAIATPDRLREFVDMGYNFISAGADVVGLMQLSDNIAEAFSRL
jgi:4-hydroxy-2-oxoheptanedioate aldolase